MDGRCPRFVVSRSLEDVQDSCRPALHAQAARARAKTIVSGSRARRAARRLVRGEPGRVLRHHRAQRLRQEHDAQVPRRASTSPTGARSRSPGRVSPFIELGRRLQPRADRRSTTWSSTRRCSGCRRRRRVARFPAIIEFAELERVRRPEAQELLVGHAGAARLRRRRSRPTPTSISSTRCSPSATPASRRSASTTFRRLKREGRTVVFVTPRPRDRRALLRPRAAARAGRGGRDRRAARRRPGSIEDERTSSNAAEAGSATAARALGRRRGRDRGGWFEDDAGRPDGRPSRVDG